MGQGMNQRMNGWMDERIDAKQFENVHVDIGASSEPI
jgi:hypothetical protein